MNWLDIAILVIVAVAGLTGLKAGIVKMVLSLAGVIIGTVLAGRYYVALAGQLTFISQANVAKVVAFAVIFIVILLIASVVAAVFKRVLSAVMLGWANRLGGAFLGVVLGTLFCGALLAMWVKFMGAGAITGSPLATLLLDRFPVVLALLPGEFSTIRSFFQ